MERTLDLMDREHGYKLFIVFLICSLLLLLRLFWTYVSSIIIALLIASVFYPLYARIRTLLQGRKNLASLVMCVFVLLALVLPAGWFVGTLSNEALEFYRRTSDSVSMEALQRALEQDSPWVARLRGFAAKAGLKITPESVEQLASSVGAQVGLWLYRQLSSVASNLLSFLVHFFMMMLVIFYLFRDWERLRGYLIDHLPMPQDQLEKVATKFNEMGRAVFFGNGLSGIIQGILGGFGFALFGLNAPVLWGAVIGLMAFLPVIGASVVFIPATLILLFQGQIGLGAGFFLYNALYSCIIEYLLKPRLIGKGMQMNSLLVFIGIIGGIKMFGILGIIYGPLTMTIFLTLAEIYRLEYKQASA